MFRKLVSSILMGLLFLTAAHADPIVTGSKPFTFIPGTVISSSQVNADFDYIINQVNTNAAKNGVNSSITALLGLTTPIAPNFGGSSIYTSGAAGGTANVVTVSTTQPAVSSYSLAAGNFVLFVASATNTAATTLNVNATGAVAIQKTTASGLVALTGGEIVNGQTVLTYYDGTRYVLLNQYQLFGVETNVASAGTTDLALAGSHNINITGTTGITSFGSNASTSLPLYYVKFAGALTITYNGTSLITPGAGNIVTAAGDQAWIEYLGSGNWRINSYEPKVNTPIFSGAQELVATNNAATPTTQFDIDATNSIVCNTDGYCIKTGLVNLTINAATTGANGLDTGALANNTWYYYYIISNGSTTAGLMSTSATAPTMPAGYVYKHRTGSVRTLGAATFVRIIKRNEFTQYQVVAASTTPNYPILISGASGSVTIPTYTTVSYVAFAPPVATRATFIATAASGQRVIVSPNNSTGNSGSAANAPPINSLDDTNIQGTFQFENATNVFYASGGSDAALAILGWFE